ncbi:MAG: hypothetical protein VR70_06030, partial [Rhodospirillaceae bacterium BRH_c57]
EIYIWISVLTRSIFVKMLPPTREEAVINSLLNIRIVTKIEIFIEIRHANFLLRGILVLR